MISDNIIQKVWDTAREKGIPEEEVIRLAVLCKEVYNASAGFHELEIERGYGAEIPVARAREGFVERRAAEVNKMVLDLL